MADRTRVDPDATLGDALAGSGGMSEPAGSAALWTSAPAEVFPDALSALPLSALPFRALPAGPVLAAALVPTPPAQRLDRQQLRPAGRPPRNAQPPPARRPPTGWNQPGQPPPGIAVPVPVLAPDAGRRPMARAGYVPVSVAGANLNGVPRPTAYTVLAPAAGASLNGVPRPAADTAPNARLPQIAAALRRARPPGAGSARTPGSSARTAGNVWSLLVFLAIILFATGLGQKVVALISEFLQRR